MNWPIKLVLLLQNPSLQTEMVAAINHTVMWSYLSISLLLAVQNHELHFGYMVYILVKISWLIDIFKIMHLAMLYML